MWRGKNMRYDSSRNHRDAKGVVETPEKKEKQATEENANNQI